MTNEEIEAVARDLQRRVWRARHELWPEGVPSLIEMLDPSAAARLLKLRYEVHEELGSAFAFRGGARYETAGLIDRQARKIAISRRFPRESARFTGAHELGHWLLHPRQVMHRDRPVSPGIGSSTVPLPKEEREADRFAACYLMPRKLLTRMLEVTFGIKAPLVIDDDSAFRLSPHDPDSILRADEDSLDRCVAVASARHYGTLLFNSLAKQFDVSVSTMARRLHELELVR